MRTTRDLVRLQEKYKNEKVTIVAVYSSRSSEAAFQKHIMAELLTYPAIYDRENRIATAYGITKDGHSYPVTPTFLIGRDGRVIWEKTQMRHWPKSVATLEALIDERLEKPGVK